MKSARTNQLGYQSSLMNGMHRLGHGSEDGGAGGAVMTEEVRAWQVKAAGPNKNGLEAYTLKIQIE